MLYVTFNEPVDFNRDVDVYFNNRYEKEWLQDNIVKEMIMVSEQGTECNKYDEGIVSRI